MNDAFPSAGDGKLWDLHFCAFATQATIAADELQLFDELAREPATPAQVSERLKINRRAARALLGLLASAELLVQRDGRYHVTQTARNYLLRSSPYYWGPVLSMMRRVEMSNASVLASLKAPETASHWAAAGGDAPIDAWSQGNIAPELARHVAEYMNATALPAALTLARTLDLSGSRRLLDVGAGSGCYSIALARENRELRCTLMDLKGMCDVAMEYVSKAGLSDQVDACPLDMFRQTWPAGYDAVFLSNILHDWDFETASMLVQKAYDALAPGGQILIHEMLLDESHDGPARAAAFSFFMLLGTKGQQYTATELVGLFRKAGFRDPRVMPAHGYYALVSARK
jgi:predicted O-methyltransferase YrrM